MGHDGDGHEPTGRDAPRLRQRLRYRFDNLLARGTSATLIWLAVVTAAAVLVSSLLLVIAGVTFAGSEDGRWLEDIWQSLLRVMDPGTMASDVGWGRRVLALLITVFGLLVAGTLIGVIAAGVETRIDSMRRGRSVVIESDHVVVLGASDRLPVVLQQLVLAGAEGGSRTIVVLADLDPAEMHEAARTTAASRGSGIRIVYRSGDPTVPADLSLTRLATARAAIVLSDGRSDVAAIETVLAIASELGGLDDLTVVVELLDEESAGRLRRAYGGSIHPVVTFEAVARTTAFALRQRGLGRVIRELLDFEGADVHLVERADLVGVSFGGLVRGLANARPIGLYRASGRTDLCPSFDALVGDGDRVVVIADDARELDIAQRRDEAAIVVATTPPVFESDEERLVVIGWNALGRNVLAGLADASVPVSSVEVVVDPNHTDPASVDLPDFGTTPTTVRTAGDALDLVAALAPSTVVFLAPPGDPAAADSRTILDVHALRRELATTTDPMPRLVVELHDARHESLIHLDGPDDLIMSDAMGSQFIAQLVDQPVRRDVLLALYTATDVALRLIPCDGLDLVGEHIVGDLVDRVAARGLIVIGWVRTDDPGITLNPHLADRVRLAAGDQLVVIGEVSTPSTA